jgi:quinol monooxygenase YgiN
MIVVIAQASIQPQKRDAFRAALQIAVTTSRGEDGCLAYDAAESSETANQFVIVERWDQRSSLDAHLGAPHTQAFLGVAADCVAAPPSLEVFDIAGVDRLM